MGLILVQLSYMQGKFKPVKYFSIDRVFRNETLDATHLAEFHQIEGVVADYNLTLGDLMGVLQAFFSKMGMTLAYSNVVATTIFPLSLHALEILVPSSRPLGKHVS